MTDMIERVARAITGWCIKTEGDTGFVRIYHNTEVQSEWLGSFEDARPQMRRLRAIAAIKAMRQPTEEMVAAGEREATHQPDPHFTYTAMIDAVFGDKEWEIKSYNSAGGSKVYLIIHRGVLASGLFDDYELAASALVEMREAAAPSPASGEHHEATL